MNREPMECPRCKEVALIYQGSTEKPPFIETWHCGECGHMECFHVAKAVKKRTPGFNEFLAEQNLDELDLLGLTDAMELAFVSGRAYGVKEVLKDELERKET